MDGTNRPPIGLRKSLALESQNEIFDSDAVKSYCMALIYVLWRFGNLLGLRIESTNQ